jgi:hypothetical protein
MNATDYLLTESRRHLIWQWDNKVDSCLLALQLHVTPGFPTIPGLPGDALAALCWGQERSPGVVEIYVTAARELGDRFWILVPTASGVAPSPGNLSDATPLLEWQIRHHLQTVVRGVRHWRDRRNRRHLFQAAVDVLSGVRHDAGPRNVYRACIRDDPDAFFDLAGRLLGI